MSLGQERLPEFLSVRIRDTEKPVGIVGTLPELGTGDPEEGQVDGDSVTGFNDRGGEVVVEDFDITFEQFVASPLAPRTDLQTRVIDTGLERPSISMSLAVGGL
ncbi:hypothetical protein [Nocardia sp. NBC_00403]|uniref:hypothetical protein n=1 Tax=Nocardia sp. NBC_00403 TaxID=2975990 RepID=UPI002E206B50